jgi:hypothetical protein
MEMIVGRDEPKEQSAEDLIRDAVLRLTRRAIEMAEDDSLPALIYILDHAPASPRIRDLNLPELQCADDAFEWLRILLNGVRTGQVALWEARDLARLVEPFVKAGTAVDKQVGVAALEQRLRQNERTTADCMNLINRLDKDLKRRGA